MATSITIRSIHDDPDNTFNLYHLTFFDNTIETLVTATPTSVDAWISKLERLVNSRPPSLNILLGLAVECDHLNRVATLQLCFERDCMVFQMLNSHSPIPQSLVNLLRNPSYYFAGVGVWNDVEKLRRDYDDIEVAKIVDLRMLASDTYGVREFEDASLEDLASRVVGREVSRPESVVNSRWDDECLTPLQVQYAAIDAFLGFEIGKVLICRNGNGYGNQGRIYLSFRGGRGPL